ncbi:MAG: GNAT family N-acetyltransferase [Elusimicrobiota bacterium]
MKIRRAAAADAALLTELTVSTFIEAYQELLPRPELTRFSKERFPLAAIREELADAASSFFLAEAADGTAPGYLKMRLHPAPAAVKGPSPIELSRIYLRRSAQGRGVGALLFRQALDCARGLGCRTLWLSVWEKNEKALGFYRKLGFREIGTQGFLYYDDRQTDLLLERPVEKGYN